MKKLILALMVIGGLSANAQSNPSKYDNVYKKAGTIKIIDKKAIGAGTMDKTMTITLKDVGVYDGHICACNTLGFLVTKEVMNKLFEGKTPMRNTMNISMSSYTQDIVDAIEFITGNRLDGGKYTNTKSDFIIDPSLEGKQGTVTFLFERKDNGEKVKVVLDRQKLLSKEEAYAFMQIKPKMEKKIATKEEKELLKKATISVVTKEITNMPKGALTFEVI